MEETKLPMQRQKERGYSDVVGESYKINGTCLAKSPTNLKATVRKNKVTLTGEKASDVTGYEIYYRKGKNDGYQKLASTAKRKYTYTKLKKGTTYYFRVRSYKQV